MTPEVGMVFIKTDYHNNYNARASYDTVTVLEVGAGMSKVLLGARVESIFTSWVQCVISGNNQFWKLQRDKLTEADYEEMI